MLEKFTPNVEQAIDDIYIKVTPNIAWYIYNDKEDFKCIERLCDQIESDIKRHIDNIDSTEIIIESHNVCIYCGNTPDEDNDTGKPWCCNKAQQDYNKVMMLKEQL